MPTVTMSRTIAAPPTAVWAVLTDVTLLPTISPSTESVVASGPLADVGDSFSQTVRLGGRRFTSDWTVAALEPLRLLRVEGSVLPGVRYRMTEELHEAGHSTDLALTIDYRLPLGPLGRLAGRIGAERAALDEARQVLDGIDRLATSRSPRPPQRSSS